MLLYIKEKGSDFMISDPLTTEQALWYFYTISPFETVVMEGNYPVVNAFILIYSQ